MVSRVFLIHVYEVREMILLPAATNAGVSLCVGNLSEVCHNWSLRL